MNLTDIIALLISLTAVLAYLNHRWIKLPTTIGVMAAALAFSLSLFLIDLTLAAVLG